MGLKQRLKVNIIGFIIIGILHLGGFMYTLYYGYKILIIRNYDIEDLKMLFPLILGIIVSTIVMIYVMSEFTSIINPKFYKGILLTINYNPNIRTGKGGDPVNALIYEIKLVDTGKIVRVEEEFIKDKKRQRDVCADGTDIIQLYSYNEFSKVKYDIRDYESMERQLHKYWHGEDF